MNNDYFQELIDNSNTLFSSTSFKQIEQDLMGENLLFQLTKDFDPNTDIDVDQAISFAYRIEQIAIRLWENREVGDYYDYAISAFEKAAKLFEYLTELQQINDNDVLCLCFFHSAINFSLGEFQANALVISRKALRIITFTDNPDSRLLKISFLLLQKQITQIQYELINLEGLRQEFDIDQETDILNDNFFERLENIAHLLSLEAMLFFARYLQNGSAEDLEKVHMKMDSSLGIFNEIRDPENYILTKLIFLLFQQIQFSSVWYQLGELHNFNENPILTRYLRILTNSDKPIFELWKSQIACLDKILAYSPATVISLPTSAGKTRIAEIKIVHTLAKDESKRAKCIYIAPYKALMNQIENSLQDYFSDVGFRVSSIIGSYETIDVDDLIVEQSDILVTTPEKLDYLYRQQPDFFSDVKLIVIDEGHIIDNDERGLRLEFLLYRLKTKYALEILFISAVIPNANEIATWLCNQEKGPIIDKWKPTKLRQGVFYWGQNWIGNIHYVNEKLRIQTSLKREIIQIYNKKNPEKKLKEPRWYPRTKYDIAIELAISFSTATPTIIFTAVRNHIDSIAASLSNKLENEIFELDKSHNENRIALSNRIEEILGNNFPLSKYVLQGFAYHHALLPDNLRLEIEEAFTKGCIPILIATDTLAHGVNLPVKLLLVAHLNRGNDNPFLVRDFRNIAGRTGRALHETEGQVILIQNTQSPYVVQQNYQYLQDNKIESVYSALFKLYEILSVQHFGMSFQEYIEDEIEHIEFPFFDDPQNKIAIEFQTQLLTIVYEELLLKNNNLEDIEKFLNELLFGYQCKINNIPIKPIKKYTKKQIDMIYSRLDNPIRREAYYRTGLSITSCENLEVRIREKIISDSFIQIRDADNKLNEDKLRNIFEIIEIPTKTKCQSNIILSELWDAMIIWINFGTIINICQTIDTPFFRKPINVSNLVYKHFTTNGPWALNSMLKILSYLQKEESITYDSELNFFPAYLKYGVNTPIATYMLGLNIGTRATAKTFSDYYLGNINQNIPSFRTYFDWLMELTNDELKIIIINKDTRYEILTQLNKFKDSDRPSDFFSNPESINFRTYIVGVQFEDRLQNANELVVGEQLILQRDKTNKYDFFALKVLNSNNKEIGFIKRSKAFILSTLIDEGIQFSAEIIRIFPDSREVHRRFLLNIKYDSI